MDSEFQIRNVSNLVGPCDTLFGVAIPGYMLLSFLVEYVLLMAQSIPVPIGRKNPFLRLLKTQLSGIWYSPFLGKA